MSVRTRIFCDRCDAELFADPFAPKYFLEVTAEQLAPTSKIRAAVHITPPIDGPKHFCGPHCLHAWAENLVPA